MSKAITPRPSVVSRPYPNAAAVPSPFYLHPCTLAFDFNNSTLNTSTLERGGLLKIATAGSVDDGKSTLIGRLLYDTRSLTDDKLEAIARTSKQKGYDYLDFSLATDGLVAEREQGITIDVAHIYFSTPRKSFIIADTPGHVEYTRNMVTGASTSQAAIILIDARKGVIEQTYRHYFINNLLLVDEVIVAINKMDLVGFDESRFNQIKADFEQLTLKRAHAHQRVTFIPVSALLGDNVVDASGRMPWYDGPTLLQHLESLDTQHEREGERSRFVVQSVIRPKTEEFHDFRGFAGRLYGAPLRVGEAVTILPSMRETTVKSIHFAAQCIDEATHLSSVTVSLADEVNVSRGDMLVRTGEAPEARKQIRATVVWMDAQPLRPGDKLTLQHGVHRVLAKAVAIVSHVTPDYSREEGGVPQLGLNDMGDVEFVLNKAIYADAFLEHRSNGAFILISPTTHHTAGVGFVR